MLRMDAAVSPEREQGKAGERGWPVCVRGPGSDRGEAARVRSASGRWGGGGSERGADPTQGRRGGGGMRPAPSLPRPLRCVEAARAHLGVLGYCPIPRPPSSGPGRTGRWLRARAAAAAPPPLGSRRRGGAWRAALWERRGVGRGRWDGGRRGGADGRAGRFRLTWRSVRRPLRLPLRLGDWEAARSAAHSGTAAEGSRGRKEGRQARPFRSRCQGDGETRVEGSGLLILPRDLVKGWVTRKRPIWLKVEKSPELTPFARDWTE